MPFKKKSETVENLLTPGGTISELSTKTAEPSKQQFGIILRRVPGGLWETDYITVEEDGTSTVEHTTPSDARSIVLTKGMQWLAHKLDWVTNNG